MARFFGTGVVTDAYRGSQTLALSPVHLLTTHLLQTCFIPLYVRGRNERQAEATTLFYLLLAGLIAIGLAIAAALFFWARPITELLLPGFDPARQETATQMIKIMALGVPAYTYAVLLSSLGAAHKDFLIPALKPGLHNLFMLVAIVLAGVLRRPLLMAYGFAAAFWALSVAGTLYLHGRGMLPRFSSASLGLCARVAGQIWRPLRPLLIVSVLVYGNPVVERFIASLVGPGTVGAMDFARFVTDSAHTLLLVPLGLISLSHFADLELDQLRAKTDRLLAILILALVPVSAFLVLSGRSLLALIYMRGEFDLQSLELTSRGLYGLSLGLWAVGGCYFLRNVLSSRLRNSEVLRGEALGIVISLIIIFSGYRQLGILAIGLGPSVGAVATLVYYFRRLGFQTPSLWRIVCTLLIALPPYVAAAWLLRHHVDGLAGLGLQVLLMSLYWGIIFLRYSPVRKLLVGGGSASE